MSTQIIKTTTKITAILLFLLNQSCLASRYEAAKQDCEVHSNRYRCAHKGSLAYKLGRPDEGRPILTDLCSKGEKAACSWLKKQDPEAFAKLDLKEKLSGLSDTDRKIKELQEKIKQGNLEILKGALTERGIKKGKPIWISSKAKIHDLNGGKAAIENYESFLVEEITTREIGSSNYIDYEAHISIKNSVNEVLLLVFKGEFDVFTYDPIDKNWSKKIKKAIREGSVVMDMTPEQVILSIGFPDKKNNTTTKVSVKDQWVYPNDVYIYFTDKRVSAWQH